MTTHNTQVDALLEDTETRLFAMAQALERELITKLRATGLEHDLLMDRVEDVRIVCERHREAFLEDLTSQVELWRAVDASQRQPATSLVDAG